MKRLLSTENVGGRTELWWLHTGDDGKDRITVETVQDVEPILDQNKREYAAASQSFGKGAFHKIATIPSTVIEEICRIKNISFAELMQAKTDYAQHIWKHLLNDPEFLAFRTRPGRIAI